VLDQEMTEDRLPPGDVRGTALEVCNVTRVFGTLTAVADVSLQVAPATCTVIIGLSGSGKSTLLRLVSGILKPDAGQVLIEGTDLAALPPNGLQALRRSAMGMVFQDFALLPHLTVLDNVALPLRMAGVGKTERRTRARALLETVLIADKADRYPDELSGGQKQRVGIARSLVNDPRLWFLDEPFSALDPIVRHELQDLVADLQARLRKTILFVTHDLTEALKLGDQIVLMKNGHVVQMGSARSLLLSPADDYVRSFTRGIDPGTVLTVGDFVLPMNPAGQDGPVLRGDVLIRDALPRLVDVPADLRVVDGNGKVLGVFDRAGCSRMLAARR
jgi:glycine betaine/proline transport system ATP-binding protein